MLYTFICINNLIIWRRNWKKYKKYQDDNTQLYSINIEAYVFPVFSTIIKIKMYQIT